MRNHLFEDRGTSANYCSHYRRHSIEVYADALATLPNKADAGVAGFISNLESFVFLSLQVCSCCLLKARDIIFLMSTYNIDRRA